MDNDAVCIYTLTDPRSAEVRYVGKTNKPKDRLRAHINNRKPESGRLAAWVLDLFQSGLTPIMETVEETTASSAHEKEYTWIVKYQDAGANLLNSVVRAVGCRVNVVLSYESKSILGKLTQGGNGTDAEIINAALKLLWEHNCKAA